MIASGAISFATMAASNGESQTIDWTYDPAAADLDWLREGDTLTMTYVAQMNDGLATSARGPLVITITGTNDVPMITGATDPGSIAESGGNSSTQDIAAVTGTITVTDQDVGDTMSLSVTGNATASYNGGRRSVETRRQHVAALIASGAISFATWLLPTARADRQLDVRPGGGRPRLAGTRRHPDPDLSGAGE